MKQSGGCLCGSVTFETNFSETGIHACHCTTCRKWSSSPLFAISVEDITFVGEESITRFASSDWAERGFCNMCGSTMFYRAIEAPDELSGEAGSFDLPDGLPISEHYFIDEKPDYYDFQDDSPRVTGAELMARYGMNPEGKPI